MANFLQTNLGRGREATECMREFVRANGVDVVLLTEPFKREAEWKGFMRFGDDLITGFQTVAQAVSICTEITKILQSGGFKLRK